MSTKKNKPKKRVNWKKRYQNMLKRQPRAKSFTLGLAELVAFLYPLFVVLMSKQPDRNYAPIALIFEDFRTDPKNLLKADLWQNAATHAIENFKSNWIGIVLGEGLLIGYKAIVGRRRPALRLPTNDLIGMNLGVKL